MKNNEWYEIIDISKFIESTRVLVFDSFGKNLDHKEDSSKMILDIKDLSKQDRDELDLILSQEECLIMSKDYIRKTRKGCRINDKKYMEMIECFNGRMVSNMINNLANKGFLEVAYDEKLNDFVFWVKDDTKDKE